VEDPDRIEATLRLTLGYLRAAAPSPRTREYRARAESYRLVLEGWRSLPPSDAQRAALAELVGELHAAVTASVRRGSLRAVASGDGTGYGPRKRKPSD
jgi:hypothetical protein